MEWKQTLSGSWKRGRLASVAFLVQFLLTVLNILFLKYSAEVDASKKYIVVRKLDDKNTIYDNYTMFQDVNVMVFVGFGFLMTFLKHYGYGATGFTLLCSAYAVQTSLLIRGVFDQESGIYISVDINSLLSGLFSSAAVLISFGALIGKISPQQLIIMTVIEVIVSVVNEYIGVEIFKAADVGGSMFLHTFGAYFGLAVSYIVYKDEVKLSVNEETSKTSDLFAMIGTLFLWMYWPSFNAITVQGEARHRAVVNTYLALIGSSVSTFILSSVCDGNDKLSAVHLQNATLAGGVAIGATADMMIQPYGALIVGLAAGSLSTIGYRFFQPALLRYNVHDTCGVHNLHGMPGVLAGLIGIVVAATAELEQYQGSLYERYPGRTPSTNSNDLDELLASPLNISRGFDWTAQQQAVKQLSALGCTLAIAIVSGLITGYILRLPLLQSPQSDHLFNDSSNWHIPEPMDEVRTQVLTVGLTPQTNHSALTTTDKIGEIFHTHYSREN